MTNTGLGRRAASMLYDALLVLALLFLTSSFFVAVNGGESVAPANKPFYQITLALVIYCFFVGFWTRSGRTLGMQSWGLQLETAAGERPSLATATLRFFAAIIALLPLGLGFIWQLWDRDKLAWHDRISRTKIVYYPKENLQNKSTNS